MLKGFRDFLMRGNVVDLAVAVVLGAAFGVNAVVLPPGYESGLHFHERQEELYIVLAGEIEFKLGDERRTLQAGGLVRVDPSTVRGYRNTSESDDAVYVCVGGAGGYVGRDGVAPEGTARVGGPPGAPA